MITQHVPLVKTVQNAPQKYLEELLALYGPSTQLFHINPEEPSVLTGAKGTRLTIPSFSLSGLSGRPVKGTVEIRLKEAFTLGEMIMASRPTTSEDRLMESAGQLMVYASQGHSPLKLTQSVMVDLPLQKNLRNHMALRLFLGTTSTFHAYSSDPKFDWKMASEKSVRILKAGSRKYCHFQLQDLNWAGCEFFVSRRARRCMVTARPISSVEQFDSMLGYLVFKGIHSIARMYPGKYNCTAINIPEKLSATAHIIGISKGNLYYGKEVIRRASEKLVDVKMHPVLEKELVDAIHKV